MTFKRERRRGMEDIKSELSNIAVELALLKNMVDANHKTMRETTDRMGTLIEKHDKTLYGNGIVGLTSRINEASDLRKLISAHSRQDAWLFTTIIGLLLFAIGKMFWP